MVSTIFSLISLFLPFQGHDNIYFTASETLMNRSVEYYVGYHLTLNLPSGRYVLDNIVQVDTQMAMDNIYSYGNFEIKDDSVVLRDVKGYNHIYKITPEGLCGRRTVKKLQDKILTRDDQYLYLERDVSVIHKVGIDSNDAFRDYYSFAFDREVPVLDSAKLKGPTPVITEGRYGEGIWYFTVEKGYISLFERDNILSTGPYCIKGRYLFYHDDSLDHTFCLEIFDKGLGEISLPIFWYDTGYIWEKTRSNRY